VFDKKGPHGDKRITHGLVVSQIKTVWVEKYGKTGEGSKGRKT